MAHSLNESNDNQLPFTVPVSRKLKEFFEVCVQRTAKSQKWPKQIEGLLEMLNEGVVPSDDSGRILFVACKEHDARR